MEREKALKNIKPFGQSDFWKIKWNLTKLLIIEIQRRFLGCYILEPGAFSTNLLDGKQMSERVNKTWEKLSPELKEEYGMDYKNKCKYY